MVISALNRKLLRDLRGMSGQAIAIALVVGSGVAMYVMYLANFESLRGTQQAYYQRQAFADVFASLKRAPARVAGQIEAIPGVATVEPRVVTTVRLELAGVADSVMGRLVSIPDGRRPRLNDLFLRRGRWIDGARADEVIVSQGFVDAHGFRPGDAVTAIVNGRRQRLVIVGVALSPEYVYSIRPGELVPDDRRFGIFWMGERALAAWLDMTGGFNDVTLSLAPGASAPDVVARLDRLLEEYGGLGAVPRAQQLSHWTVESELRQLQTFGFLLPLLFLSVAAFTLNVALSRALAMQRGQIATLKALGYSNRSVGWHYMKWALIVAGSGIVIGLAAGAWMGSMIGRLYNNFFRFPDLLFRVPPTVVAGATALTVSTAAAGALTAVRRAVRLSPAEAMQPEPPARYRRWAIDKWWVSQALGTAGRMVVRNIGRHPVRAMTSVVGIASAVAVLMVGLVFFDAMERLIATQFWTIERQDVTVTFVEPRSADAGHELTRLPGVVAVEPLRTVAARIRSDRQHRSIAITGVPAAGRLRRIVDRTGMVVTPAAGGVVLSQMLASVLHVSTGDAVRLEILEGARPTRTVLVAGVVDDIFGLGAYMDLTALHALLREGAVMSGAVLLVDPSQEPALAAALTTIPGVAGVSFKRAALRTFRDTMAANMHLTIFLNIVFAAIIACGVVYNAARVSLSERGHELASLRVLGFTRAEISLILLGELALLTALALPIGWWMGDAMARAIARSVESEVYRFPLAGSRQAAAWAALAVLGAAVGSSLIVRRRLDRLDLIGVLKVRG